jgi:CRP-like cAMP-binding protein
MIIEHEKIRLGPLNINQILITGQLVGKSTSLQLSKTQMEVLPLLNGLSLFDIVQHYMKKKFLVSFQALRELIEFLVDENIILNPSFRTYFSHSKAPPQTGLFEDLINKVKGPEVSDIHLRVELQKIPFFRSISPELFETFLQHAKVIKTPADILVCETGQKQRSLFVLLRGQASVFKNDGKSPRRRLAVLSEGSVFGEVGFFLGEPRTADVITDQKSVIVKVKYLPEIFDSLIKKDNARYLQKRFWVIHALLKSSLFRDLPSDCFDSLLFAGNLISFPAESIICREGDPGAKCYVVVQGNLVVSKGGKNIKVLQQGDCFGEIALLLSQGQRTASVLSQTEVLALEITAEKFYQLLSENLLLGCEFERIAKSRIEQDEERA